MDLEKLAFTGLNDSLFDFWEHLSIGLMRQNVGQHLLTLTDVFAHRVPNIVDRGR